MGHGTETVIAGKTIIETDTMILCKYEDNVESMT